MTGGVTLSNGQIISGGFDGWQVCSGPTWPNYRIDTNGVPGGDDILVYDGTGSLTDAGYIGPTAVSYWTGPKSLGTACLNIPGVPTCGEPINLSSGNVFDQVTDYETAGQNKLAII
jgi:hypothetical protein